jgi:hypothetical protein
LLLEVQVVVSFVPYMKSIDMFLNGGESAVPPIPSPAVRSVPSIDGQNVGAPVWLGAEAGVVFVFCTIMYHDDIDAADR